MSHLQSQPTLDGIAIIGIAGRFPGANNIDEFWCNLQHGVESVSFFTDDELLAAGIEPALLKNPNYVKARAVLPDADMFDAAFFGFTPAEAEFTDPQHRLFFECAWEALENAAYNPDAFPGAIGVYAGVNFSTYLVANLLPNPDLLHLLGHFQVLLNNLGDYLPTRLSYKLNLTGPSLNVQTACSTSLVAVCQAVQSLLNYQCDLALAGGAAVSFPQTSGYLYQAGGIMSPDGHCRAFDTEAKGTISGEGVGVVVLKRLDEAMADGDHIYAVIRGSALNNDGSLKVGYTAPSVDGQAEVIALAQAIADVAPESIGYIEAHGTGTQLGDPVEIAALTKVFRASTERRGFCAIGSVKSNIGHLDSVAGVAGLIKTVLALQHRQLPPSLHVQQPNPKINFASTPFYVNTTLADWPAAAGQPRRAGVSSFGIGGTNAHVVLEEAPPVESDAPTREWHLLPLSAKTETALDAGARRLADYLQTQPEINLADVAYTLQVGRRAFNQRQVLVCRHPDEAVEALQNKDDTRILRAQALQTPEVAFMFSGQGAQYVGMGRELVQTEPTFKETLDQCDELLRPHLGGSLLEAIYPDSGSQGVGGKGAEEKEAINHSSFIIHHSSLNQTWLTQPALFAIEYALARLWQSWGIQPQAMIGHSIGEYVAACLAGVFSLADALRLVAARGRLMQQLPGGAMLAVSLPESDLNARLNHTLSLAAVNGSDRCVVSGPAAAIEAFQQQLEPQGIMCRRLHTSHAFHSAMMEPMLEPFTALVRQVSLRPPQIPFISNVTGTWITAAQATDPAYWADHIRRPVRFAEGLAQLLPESRRVLLEVGPGHTLSRLAQRHPARSGGQLVLSSLPHPQDKRPETALALTTLGRLWLAGAPVDWAGLYPQEQRRRVPLPTYPFERQRYWIEPPASRAKNAPAVDAPAKKPNISDWFYAPSWKQQPPPAPVEDSPRRWLLFSHADELAERLAERLTAAGHTVCRVQPGAQFESLESGRFSLNPQRREDYTALLRELNRLNQTPNAVAHLWGVTADSAYPDLNTLDESQQLGFYSLLYLAQAWGEQQPTTPLRVGVVTNNLQDVTGAEALCPHKATVLGPCRVIPQEYPHINCRSIDLDWFAPTEAGAELALDQLVAELQAESPEPVVAYRGRYRWAQSFEPLALRDTPAGRPRLKPGAVVLITGGLGGIGLALAHTLAERQPVRLVLTGRSALPPRAEWAGWLAGHPESDRVSGKIRQVQALEAKGSEVLVLAADVSDLAAMQAVIAQTQTRFGRLNGVIHAAGVAGGGLIQLKTADAAAAVLSPKVQGTLVLEAALAGQPLDFWVLCSSLNAALGVVGQVDYTAANAFLDAFARARHKEGAACTAINWDVWQEVGMAADTALPHYFETQQPSRQRDGLAVAEGQQVFERILNQDYPQVLVSTRDFEQVRTQVSAIASVEALTAAPPVETPAGAPAAPPAARSRPNLSGAYVAPRTEREQKIVDLWQKLLGLEPIGVNDNFFELGGDSLLAVRVVTWVRDTFQVDLPAQELYADMTVANLAEYLETTFLAAQTLPAAAPIGAAEREEVEL